MPLDKSRLIETKWTTTQLPVSLRKPLVSQSNSDEVVASVIRSVARPANQFDVVLSALLTDFFRNKTYIRMRLETLNAYDG